MMLLINANYCCNECPSTTYIYTGGITEKEEKQIQCIQCGNFYSEWAAFDDNMFELTITKNLFNFIKELI